MVAPLSILGVWQEEFGKFADFDYTLTILSGTTQKKTEALRQLHGSALQVAVVNYESAWRLESQLGRFAPDLIIADEGHKIKTHNIAAAKAMHRLGAKSAYRLLLTGTVITNKAIDVFSQYKFLNPDIYGNSFYAFRNRYFDMVGYGNHTPVLKQSMKSELTQKLHRIAFRATKAECLDLPNTMDIVRHVELEPSARKLYRDLVKESCADLGKGEVTVTNVLTRLLRLSQLTGGFIGENDSGAIHAVSEAKLQALADIAETAINENQKLVIIARFVPELEAICKYLDRYSTSQETAGESISCYSLIKGGVQDRATQVQRFQTDPTSTFLWGRLPRRVSGSRSQPQKPWCSTRWTIRCPTLSRPKRGFTVWDKNRIAPICISQPGTPWTKRCFRLCGRRRILPKRWWTIIARDATHLCRRIPHDRQPNVRTCRAAQKFA